MRRRAPLLAIAVASALTLTGAAAFAQTQPAPVPVVLPHQPPVTNATSRALFDAMLAISRAQQANPQAAQNASFSYTKAVQQYRSGDLSGARRSAIEASAMAAQPVQPLASAAPMPSALAPAAPQVPGTQGGLYGADAPAIDADSFLALARGMIDDCAARHDPAIIAARTHYAAAARDFAARNWQGTRVEAKAAIDACARPR